MKTIKRIVSLACVGMAALVLVSCNAIQDDSTSASLLSILSLEGTDTEGNRANYLQSDVIRINPTTGYGTIYSDIAYVTFLVRPISPDPILDTSNFYDVMVERYVVEYTQPNGANRQGWDVPYSFEGSLSRLVRVNTQEEVAFIIVRENAKVEPPLIQLQDGRDVLQCTAKVDFYGHDMANKKVKATGYLTIFFANYADPESGGSPAPER